MYLYLSSTIVDDCKYECISSIVKYEIEQQGKTNEATIPSEQLCKLKEKVKHKSNLGLIDHMHHCLRTLDYRAQTTMIRSEA